MEIKTFGRGRLFQENLTAPLFMKRKLLGVSTSPLSINQTPRQILNLNVKFQLELLNMLFLTLPPVNQHILRRILRLFKTISDNDEINKMSSKNIAVCLAPTLFMDKCSKPSKCKFLISP